LINLYTNIRTIFAISRDGLLPKIFSKISSKSKIPLFSTLFVGAIASIVAGFFSIGNIFEIVNIVMLISFMVIAVSVILLRKQHPDLERPFKCPFVPTLPILVIIFSLALITQLNLNVIGVFVTWILIGGIIYFAYKKYMEKKSETVKIE